MKTNQISTTYCDSGEQLRPSLPVSTESTAMSRLRNLATCHATMLLLFFFFFCGIDPSPFCVPTYITLNSPGASSVTRRRADESVVVGHWSEVTMVTSVHPIRKRSVNDRANEWLQAAGHIAK